MPPDVWANQPPGFYEHLHNVYLQYAADRGIPTMLAMLWMLIQMPVDFWRGLRALPPGRERPQVPAARGRGRGAGGHGGGRRGIQSGG